MNEVLEPVAVTVLSEQSSKSYDGIAFDGIFFYLTFAAENKICKFDRDFIFIHCYEVQRPYTAICYDSIEHCFWAVDRTFPRRIFQLDVMFHETAQLELRACCADSFYIRGLSFNCENNTILVSYDTCAAEFSKDGNTIQFVEKPENNSISCILSIPPYFILVQVCQHKQFLNIFHRDRLIKSYCLPDAYRIKDLAFYSCFDPQKQTLVLILLAVDSRHRSCLLKCILDFCGRKLCECNFICCHKPKDCTCDLCDIIESIAQAESGLAHILNAEGEKLQKGIEISDSICELLKLNSSVERTITKVTFLEQVLYAKLDAVRDLKQNTCCEKNDACGCPHQIEKDPGQ